MEITRRVRDVGIWGQAGGACLRRTLPPLTRPRARAHNRFRRGQLPVYVALPIPGSRDWRAHRVAKGETRSMPPEPTMATSRERGYRGHLPDGASRPNTLGALVN